MASYTKLRNENKDVIGYLAQVRVQGHAAQTKRFKLKEEAKAWATPIELAMRSGAYRDQSAARKTTLETALRRYEQEITPCKKSAASERGFIKQWLERKIAKLPLADIRGSDIAISIRAMQKEGKGPNTIRLHLAVISNLFTVARKEWDMESLGNPTQDVRKPKLPGGRERRLADKAEETLLLTACREVSPELEDIVIFAIETAMRQGEIMKMEWAWLRPSGLSIAIPRDDTKKETARLVPLTDAAIAVLERQKERTKTSKSGRVWRSTQDRMCTRYERAVKNACIEDLTFHDLRHEATSRMHTDGVPIMAIQKIVGHKSPTMLLRYSHLREEELIKASRGTLSTLS
jgi:integrase